MMVKPQYVIMFSDGSKGVPPARPLRTKIFLNFMQFFGISGTFICWRSPPGCAPDVCTYSTNLVLFCLLSSKVFTFAVCFRLVCTHLNSNLLFVFRRNVHSAATQRRSQVGVHRGGIHKHGVYAWGPVLRAADRGRWTLQRLPLY